MSRVSPTDPEHVHLVDHPDSLLALCNQLGNQRRFAFDAEFVAEDVYQPQVCLIQAASDEETWLIDPLANDLDASGFWELVCDAQIETVVHAGAEDLAIAFQHTGRVPQNVFDVQIAAGLVTTDYPSSLQKLAKSLANARLHKSQTLTDWRRRPLTPSQIQYAVEDVAHILKIRDRLGEKLEKLGRPSWAEEEFKRFSDERTYVQPERDLLWRVRGVGALSAKGLAIARELALEREELAQKLNRPARVLLKDHILTAIAKHAWTRPAEIKSLRGVSLPRWAVERLGEAVKRGLEISEHDRPQPAEGVIETPQETAIIKFVSTILYEFSQRERISHQMLCTNKDIRALVLTHTRPDDAPKARALQYGWRREAIGALMDDILEGKRAVRVGRTAQGPGLRIE